MLYIIGDSNHFCPYPPGTLMPVKADDVIIVTGEFSREICKNGCSGPDFEKTLDFMEQNFDATFCFLDGSQTQIPQLYRYPRKSLFNALAYMLRGNVYHLIRGHQYDIPDTDSRSIHLTCYYSGYHIDGSLESEDPNPVLERLIEEKNKLVREQLMVAMTVAKGARIDRLKKIDIENYRVHLHLHDGAYSMHNAQNMLQAFGKDELSILAYYYANREDPVKEIDMETLTDASLNFGCSESEVLSLVYHAICLAEYGPILKRKTRIGDDEMDELCEPQDPPATPEERASRAEHIASLGIESDIKRIFSGEFDYKPSQFEMFRKIRAQVS